MSFYYKNSREKILNKEDIDKAIKENNALVDFKDYKELADKYVDINKKAESVMTIYKNRTNKERGMSNKEAKENTGYIVQSMKRTNVNIDREYKELFQTILTTPYKCSDFEYDEIRKLFMEDVHNHKLPQIGIMLFQDEQVFEYGFYEEAITGGFTYKGKWFNTTEMKKLFEEKNFPLKIDVSINRDYYQISFYTFNHTF